MAGDHYESLREAETRCVFSSLQILLRAKPWLVLVLFFKQNRIDRISSVTRFSDVFLHCCCDVWLGWELTPTDSDHSSSQKWRKIWKEPLCDGHASPFKFSSKNQFVVIGTMLFFQ